MEQETDRRYLETYCPKLSRDCDEAARPLEMRAMVDLAPKCPYVPAEADVFEAYCMGYDEAEQNDLRVLRASTIFALFFGLACGLLGWAIGRWL